VASSIQFGSDNLPMIDSTDGRLLNQQTQNPSAMSDAAKSNIGIQTRVGTFASYNTGVPGSATQRSPVTAVQLQQPTGRIAILGTTVAPEVYENMKETSPEAFIDPAVKVAEDAKAETEAQQAEADRLDINTHPIPEIEAAHMHLNDMVSMQDKIALMVAGARGETPAPSLINRIAEQMHLPLDKAIDAINLVSAVTSAQFTALANSMNLDAGKAQAWIKEHRGDTGMVSAQAHLMRRDVKAWTPLLDDYRRATGDGVKH
jgi:hypothetical protein